MREKNFVPNTRSYPKIEWSSGNYHLTRDGWEKISGQQAPEGIEEIVLGPNGEAVGWLNNKKIILNTGTAELNEHGWPPKGSPAEKLWEAAQKLEGAKYLQNEIEYLKKPEHAARIIKELQITIKKLGEENGALKIIAFQLTKLIEDFGSFPRDYSEEGRGNEVGPIESNSEAYGRLEKIIKAFQSLKIKV